MIKADRLTMHYGPVVALNDVSFEVRRGEIVGLLGPNGAGKSTTMKILTTYLYPTAGTAQVGGYDILDNPLGVRGVIGYLPEIPPLYMDMEVKGYLAFVGKSRGVGGARLKERTDVVLEQCGLRPMYRKAVRELSKGYKQRTALAQALIHDPDIIVLDEPTSGLDPHQIVEIRQLVRSLASNKTVILSTHILQEVEAMADRIVIINRGRIVGDGTIQELRTRATQSARTQVSVLGQRADIEQSLKGLEGATDVMFLGENDGCAEFTITSARGVPIWREFNRLAQIHKWVVRELSDQPLSLEETFLSLTEPTARAARQEGDSAA